MKSGELASFVVTYVDDFAIDGRSVDVYVMDIHKNAEVVVLYLEHSAICRTDHVGRVVAFR
jgi:hypothetical protein